MRTVHTMFLAGAAVIVFAGFAHAQSPNCHTLKVPLPGAAGEQIRCQGDRPPEIFLRPEDALIVEPSL